jgi:hypothetical protein
MLSRCAPTTFQATKDNTAAIQDNTATLQEQNDLLKQQMQNQQNLYNVSQAQYGTLAQAIAAVVSGQIGGKVGLGFQTRSFAGGVARY